jgi:hypothetical protein
MPVLKTEFSCPRCKKETGQANQILANAGELTCSVNGSHKWNDTMTFYNENPVMEFKVAMPKALPQENHTPLTISVPIKLKEFLEAKYTDKLSSTAASILSQMAEGNAMIIPESDIDRLADGQRGLGTRPKNSSELCGLIFAKMCEVSDAKEERDAAVKDLKAYEGMSPGRIVVDLGAQFPSAAAKAKEAELPLKVWLETQFKSALENNWF